VSGSKARLRANDAVKGYAAPPGIFPSPEPPGQIFGQNVFTKAVMQQRLPKARVQVVDGDDRAFQAARSDGR
jgi:glutamine synthetase